MRILVCLLVALFAGAAAGQDVPQFYLDLARETLAPNDGWASFGAGTTGGSSADAAHVFVVTNRSELRAALAGTSPKIIFVKGTISLNVDDNNLPLTCADYARDGYTLEAYLAAYDPAVWGQVLPSGPLENARLASRNVQQNRVRLNVTSNTTLIGVGPDARLVGAHVRINNAANVIIRNLVIEDAYDCFPQWDPTDGSQGNWNAAYDNISVMGSSTTNVWIDHCEFTDGVHLDRNQPEYFGRPFVVHDGALDITNAADLVTVSWNHFREHDKVMLIGSSDSATADVGKLRVTLHHNFFEASVQRTPRVRYGQVHVFNNYYLPDAATYSYSWGVGFESQIFAENNYFETYGKIAPSHFISRFNGTMIHVANTLVDGSAPANRVDVVAAYNSTHDPDLSGTVLWTPTLFVQIHPTQAVAGLVRNNTGPLSEE